MKNKEKFVLDQMEHLKKIHEDFNHLIQYKNVLSKAASILGGRVENDPSLSLDISKDSVSVHESLMNAKEITIGHLAGVILREEQERFNKLIFRATRGNAIVCFKELSKPIVDYVGRKFFKSAYVIIFQEGEFIRDKIIRVCDSFSGERYEIPYGGFTNKLKELEIRIRDARKILTNTRDELRKFLSAANTIENEDSSALVVYEWYVVKEKAIFTTLDKCRKGDKLFFGLYWIPNNKIAKVTDAIVRLKVDRNVSAPQVTKRELHSLNPPSYIYLNEFTEAFQDITDTYGVPAYQEVNSGFFNIVTFPLLFGVMFGDIGHGGLVFLLSIFVVLFPDFFTRLGLGGVVKLRYLIFMLGMFSFFAGLCYNDFMSIPLELPHGSCYDTVESDEGHPMAVLKEDCVYPIGFDPKWYLSSNGLTYMNSMKMKLSVILGVAQMCIGIMMKGLNAIHFRRPIDFLFEFVPQIILMLCLFGYMDALIIVKWFFPWQDRTAEAPSIITTMIGMFLKFGEIPAGSAPLLHSAEYQQNFSQKLLLVSLICVPTMLFVKPIWFLLTQKHEHQSEHKSLEAVLPDEERHEGIELADLSHDSQKKLSSKKDVPHESDKPKTISIPKDEQVKDAHAEELKEMKQADAEKPKPFRKSRHPKQEAHKHHITEVHDLLEYIDKGDKGTHDFSEVFIHQLIETIEFVLGTVSNTASYLRLWALSLAHSQLAAVFFEKLLGGLALETNEGRGSAILVFFMFPIFFSFTLFVLMCMDSMECFLHCIRLHWVEFQNKFYKGNGYKFAPYSHSSVLTKHNEAIER